MKTKFIALPFAFAMLAAPAFAWEGQVKACYGKVWSPAEYSVTEILVKPARNAYEHRKGQLVEMYYPPVYKEKKTLTHKAHWIMRKEACN